MLAGAALLTLQAHGPLEKGNRLRLLFCVRCVRHQGALKAEAVFGRAYLLQGVRTQPASCKVMLPHCWLRC